MLKNFYDIVQIQKFCDVIGCLAVSRNVVRMPGWSDDDQMMTRSGLSVISAVERTL